ncbi:RNA polymerase sigma factor [Anaerovorax odorimutans]|uniref:RNA polymerase sigma factor n=1 Tax=Anaerovorax odorimutans TaxID=109327 RepID=UPI0003F70BDF|nr:sigma-70 family RNA polymerase sigma factor [Anaerovorax odorimutans]
MTDFEEIYKQHFTNVYKYVLTLCKDESTAEEITQETFFKAIKNIKKFKGNCKLYVWLCQIAKNTYFTQYQKQKKISDTCIDFSNTPFDLEKNYLDKETIKRLHCLIHNMKEPYKEVFTLRVFGELPFTQIGELFEKTDNWARLIFYRAKKQLQEELK